LQAVTEPILLREQADGVVQLTLNRPEMPRCPKASPATCASRAA